MTNAELAHEVIKVLAGFVLLKKELAWMRTMERSEYDRLLREIEEVILVSRTIK